MSLKKVGLYTATSIVIANMVGTGVFTSLHFQVMGLHSGFTILMLWVIGGIAALLGALCYGEIGSAFPRSGGEYNYLSKLYHPSAGFLSGWVSATVGFSAPVASAAIALGTYTSSVYSTINPTYLAAVVVIILSLIHSTNLSIGSLFQNFFTTLKVIIILGLIVAGLFATRTGDAGFRPTPTTWTEFGTSGFVLSLYFVSYSYSGWNAAAYIAGEINEPKKNLPRSLLIGTSLVTAMYVLLNYIFLRSTPMAELGDKFDVGHAAASHIFNASAGNVMGIVIALLLVSSASSMIMAGPRVTQMIGEDFSLFKFFAKKNKNGIPVIAIALQAAISLFFVFTSTFDQVLTYIGFTLNLFTFLTVAGIFILRYRNKNEDQTNVYKTWGYPVTPILFLAFGGFLLVYGLMFRPNESLAGFATVLAGLVVYFISEGIQKKKNTISKNQ